MLILFSPSKTSRRGVFLEDFASAGTGKIFKTMTGHEKRKLEEELFYLRVLIDFHNGAKETLWKAREKELEAYMDDMLDYMNELRRKLGLLSENDKNKK